MPAVASYAPRGQPTRQGRNRPQRVQLFRNDNWPPRPPAQALPVPSFLGSPDSDTLLRALPTPSFVTPPEVEEVKPGPPVPTKAVIAASAVPLADWFADVVWALYLGPTVASGGGNSGLAGADKAPQPLAAFVHAVLSQTLASPQCAALGLYYLVRLPVRLGSAGAVRIAAPLWNVGVDSDGHTCYASVHDRERAARAAFVAELYGPGGEDVPYRLAALALMLGNKWLDDHTFTNKTWHEVTHLSLARLTALEQRALECFNYSLGVSNENWRAWLGVLKEEAQGASTLEPNPMSALAIDCMERLEKELEVLVGGVGAGVVDVFAKGVIGDRRSAPAPTTTAPAQSVPTAPAQSVPTAPAQSVPTAPAQSSVPFPVQSVQSQSSVPFPSAPTEMELDELEMAQVEIDIDLDDGGPVPDELRRPVKVRLGAGGKVEDEAWVEKGWGVKSEEVWGAKSDEKMQWGAKSEDKWGVAKEEKMQWGVKSEDKWGAKTEEKQWGEKWDDEMEGSGDEWERALRAAGGDQFVMGIVEDGEDRYARERLARDGAEWDRAVQRPGKDRAVQDRAVQGRAVQDRAVQRPDKQSKVKNASAVGSELKAKQAHVPRVELYDARLRCDYPQYYAGYEGYPKRYDGYQGHDGYPTGYDGYPAQGFEGYPAKGYDGVGKGAYEYPSKGVYYPAYEAVPRDAMFEPGCVYDLGTDATAGFDYGCPYGYVPRRVPVPSWVPRSGGCVLS